MLLTIAILVVLLAPTLITFLEQDTATIMLDLTPAITHSEALEMCEDKGMAYDPEAEGYTTDDFCYMTMDDI